MHFSLLSLTWVLQKQKWSWLKTRHHRFYDFIFRWITRIFFLSLAFRRYLIVLICLCHRFQISFIIFTLQSYGDVALSLMLCIIDWTYFFYFSHFCLIVILSCFNKCYIQPIQFCILSVDWNICMFYMFYHRFSTVQLPIGCANMKQSDGWTLDGCWIEV